MTTESQANPLATNPKKSLSIKIFGVGGAGVRVADRLASHELAGVTVVALNTDAQCLENSPAENKIHLETKPLRGLGTGGDPEQGRAIAEEHSSILKAACEGVDLVLIVAGLGGGAGTGISPVLARAAREAGALVIGFVITPFDCEGSRRQGNAREGLEDLKAVADGIICLPNQRIFKLLDENTSVLETFNFTNELLAEGIRGFCRLLIHSGLIEIHFSDICTLLRDQHTESAFAVAEAAGATRSREAVEKILAHPMLDGGRMLAESDVVIISLLGGPDLTMAEVNRVMQEVGAQCEQAQVLMGAAIDDQFQERLSVTLIAARKNQARPEVQPRAGVNQELEGLLSACSTPRPGSRFVPPPPELAPEQIEQLLSRQRTRGSSSRKGGSRMRQTQLPLEIISKGRFDKSEPTIHKGEDLDVPTYIRRGISLN